MRFWQCGQLQNSDLGGICIVTQVDYQRRNISDASLHYDDYCGLGLNLGPSSGIDLDIFFDQDLLWAQPGGAVGWLKERLYVTSELVYEVGCVVPVFENGCLDLFNQLGRKERDARQKLKADRCELSKSDRKIIE